MPASTLEPVSAALRNALSKNAGNSESISDNNLDQQLAGSTKKALLSNIEFEPAGTYKSSVLDKLKSKYIVLKSSETPPPSSKSEDGMGADETLKLAKYELYPLEAVQLGWNNCDWSVGAGMVNMGNTCYLNSTLQALFHVPALANWLMSDKDHSIKCQESGGLCIICAMRKTLQDSQQRNATTIRPLLIYNKLRLVCRNLIPGRQEDAHEFLRYLVEAMEKAYLSRFKNHTELDSKIKETTPLNQILGGYLRSAVRCLKCGHVSTTFQHFQDLLLDIRKAQTLDEALELYFSREKLDDESYQCEACKRRVPATKQFGLERAPMVLCIQLKRFSVSNNKITKHIQFRQRLDLTKYARHRPNLPLIYRLVALVTHMGPTVNCGHYTAVAQAPSGNFYQFDDSMVRPISHQAVFNTNAYIMFYELESQQFAQKNNSTTNSAAKLNNANSNTHNNESAPSCSSGSSNSPSTSTKATLNGIGYTSDKVYGPELPPDRLNNKTQSSINGHLNGTVNISNGHNNKENLNNSSSSSGNSSSSSDSESEESKSNNNKIKSKSNTPNNSNNNNQIVNKSPTLLNNHKNLSSSRENSTSISSLSSPETSPKKFDTPTKKNDVSPNKNDTLINKIDTSTKKTVTPTKKLVPYESDDDDSSNKSDDTDCGDKNTNNKADKDVIIPTKASTKTTNGEWKVTPTTADKLSQNNSKPVTVSPVKNRTVTETLFKMSHDGYSAPVISWNGTRSQLEKEVQNEKRVERKRTLTEDNSMDQGRVKHVKANSNSNHNRSNPGYNPVQEFHNAKNWNQNNTNGNSSNYHYKSFFNRHRRPFFKNYQKNYRYRQQN